MKKGFTLAEVLITLGIIGVVAAMTLPIVINNMQNKKLEVALKKSYSVLGQIIQRIVIEDFGGTIDVNNAKALSTYVVKYYKNGNLCSNNGQNGCPTVSDMCTFMQTNYKTYNGKKFPGCVGNDAVSNTIDNTTLYFDTPNSNEGEATTGKILLAVDVNGWQNKPNRWGHDIFVFQINKNGKILPMGIDGTYWDVDSYCSRSSTNNMNGYGCTIKALNDKDYFKNLPK